MTRARRFAQVDVFGSGPVSGNALAVVLDGTDLDDGEMARFARWTNLSETTFVLPPTVTGADYRVRIWTPSGELPFAGHPTLGTCHVWLEAGGVPTEDGVVRQECPAGIITIRRGASGLAFAAPPLLRSGPADPATVERVAAQLDLATDRIVDMEWVDNGPGWIGVLLASADEVLALRPGPVDLDIGVVGAHPAGSPTAWEVRAFMPPGAEDPVTGSLNAGLAGWLLGSGRATVPYVAAQGTAIGRAGRIRIDRDDDGVIWTGGATATVVAGQVEL